MTPHIPDRSALPDALTRTTHLAIGAHQDDLEFMAYHGIISCYQEPSNWFTGITCTDGGGSPRTGPFADHSDAAMKDLRHREQNQAADLGHYAAQYQLGHSSSHLKSPSGQSDLRDQLATLLQQTTPHTVYTHNPADKHATHLAVFTATIAALRSLPKEQQPTTFLGCEVWRDLDWVPDTHKVSLDVSPHPDLATRLNQVFQSQIAGGKNYHHAIIGRRTAHATFSNPHTSDTATQLIFALDLMPLLEDPALSPTTFISQLIDEFKNEVDQQLATTYLSSESFLECGRLASAFIANPATPPRVEKEELAAPTLPRPPLPSTQLPPSRASKHRSSRSPQSPHPTHPTYPKAAANCTHPRSTSRSTPETTARSTARMPPGPSNPNGVKDTKAQGIALGSHRKKGIQRRAGDFLVLSPTRSLFKNAEPARATMNRRRPDRFGMNLRENKSLARFRLHPVKNPGRCPGLRYLAPLGLTIRSLFAHLPPSKREPTTHQKIHRPCNRIVQPQRGDTRKPRASPWVPTREQSKDERVIF